MYKLMVSQDCGASYYCERESYRIEDFKERTEELDNQMIRWGIDDEDNNPIGIPCKIHREIIQTMQMLNNQL